ncbi:SbcC/MukB-like Walker B domain-containing protein [Micromonospora sp. NPDC049230]|uniref:SbcC/MukB-like Walker B domain-containing protein n=1 Tax=Micromonospora sp. NPDC049230 TaxID=3155502 RepID=UPI00340D335E
MSVIPHQVRRLPEPAVEDVAGLGVPRVVGRWQPTRAGAVNSWAWTDEVFLFADGWLALAGPNGSGKSLTASMLVTMLLDADTSQKALSVSGEAAGTLIDRHTDRTTTEDRTGAWWLEYGLRTADSEDVRYLTTGLWLRSQGGSLQRAFFLTPGRVGIDVYLQRDRDPVAVEDLAAQLAALDGRLFTSHDRLTSKAKPHLRVADEDQYRDAVRTTLFAPLDTVQFDALLGVLRSLRSVRTAEAISPNAMRTVLTEALPALDPRALQFIADTMERIADLERQLQQARSETRQLEQAEQQYGRYLDTVTAVEAAQLSHAQTVFDDHARQVRAAEDKLSEAARAAAAVAAQRADLRTTITELKGKLQATDAALRDHAGAELPQLEERLTELHKLHDAARQRRDDLDDDAQLAAAAAEEALDQAASGQRHLSELVAHLLAGAAEVGAQAFVDRIADTSDHLTSSRPGSSVTLTGLAQLTGTPQSWVQARLDVLQRIDAAMRELDIAHEGQRGAAAQVRAAEADRDRYDQAAEQAVTARQTRIVELGAAVQRWDIYRVELPAVPTHLLDTGERTDPDALVSWLHRAGTSTRQRIALAAREQDVLNAGRNVTAAETALSVVAGKREKAAEAAVEAERGLARAQQQAVFDHEAADERARQDHAAHEAAVHAAQQITTDAEQALADGGAAAAAAERTWAHHVAVWRTSLVHLDSAAVVLPGDLDIVDLHQPARAVQQAHATLTARLQRSIAAAEHDRDQAQHTVDDLDAELRNARRQSPVPAAPPWRAVRHQDACVPFWAAVAFASQTDSSHADRLEGALLVSGLLDAAITHDGRLIGDGDLTLSPHHSVPGRSLANLLTAEPDCGIDPHRITSLLRSITIDDLDSDTTAGRLRVGPLIATAPRGYRAAFIGRTARERARLARVTDLEHQLAAAGDMLAGAQQHLQSLHQAAQAAQAEVDSFPATDDITRARDTLVQLRLALAAAEQRTTKVVAEADAVMARALAAVAATRTTIDRGVLDARQQVESAGDALHAALEAETAATGHLDTMRAELATEVDHRDQAQAAEDRCAHEEHAFPDLDDLRQALRDEDAADQAAIAARARVTDHERLHRDASTRVAQAQQAVNTAATQPDSTMLPTSAQPLNRHRQAVESFDRQISTWSSAAQRTLDLLTTAHTSGKAAGRTAAQAQAAATEAGNLQQNAVSLQARVEQTRALYGAEYTHLLRTRETLEAEHDTRQADDEALGKQHGKHEVAEAEARLTLTNLAPQRAETEQARTRYHHRMGLLATYGFADVPDDIAHEPDGTPANITAALSWARRILAQRQGTTRLDTLIGNRDRMLRQLENTTRTVNQALAAFDQQLDITTLENTDWRRVTLAAPNAAVGDDLRHATATLRTTVAGLEADLRHDIKGILKTSTFIQLRRDIQQRREAAQELVRQIRATLQNVRTGVARVGVQVDWKVREDDNARQMVDLLTAPPADQVFESMYDVLRRRMEEAGDETWTDRVAHTFDYRSWHEWHISVTHSSFGVDQFKPVNARSNPLKSLSTGESRLATMLPLLAAAWSMYSGTTYQGPRLLTIDEIDAAFDDKNLRQVLALLRTWKFDVLATTPSIAPLIKRESRDVVIHEVITTAGRHRVTIPWLWNGAGEATPVTLPLPATRTES